MIRKSFIFLPRIGLKKELILWNHGFNDWNDYLSTEKLPKYIGINSILKQQHNRILLKAKNALYSSDSEFFAKIMPQKHHWRLYDFFKEEALYLDIETAGGYMISVVGVYSRLQGLNRFVRGFNLDSRLLQSIINKHKLLVTFNGSCFDVPILKRYGLSIKIPHIDLRFVCANLGLTNGLKHIEKLLGIKRNEAVSDIKGNDTVSLWYGFKLFKKKEFFELLLDYNEEDVVNLELLANKVIPLLKEKLEAQATKASNKESEYKNKPKANIKIKQDNTMPYHAHEML